ncbi:MAG: acetylornithine deacetylase [Gammaproteobacteria bacterium]|nr:acetylornithine deacetylase [Gammaproteobacteria bacterium]
MAPPPLLDMIEALIASPSVSSINAQWDQSNQGVIELLRTWLEGLGFQIETMPIPGNPGKFNLIASAGAGPGGLVLAGHTDTVPFDENRWNSDPFILTERDHKLYGLGTSDMKAFLALAIEAVRDLDLPSLKHPLVLLATADEESRMCGAQALVDTGRKLGRHVIIGEPTGLKPVRMHKGVAMETIRVIGRSGHSSNPGLGVSALEGMHRVIGEILTWRHELQTCYSNPLFEVDVPTLNLGHIQGGDNPNRICGECELQIDLRPLPGMKLDDLRTELGKRLEGSLSGQGLQLQLEPSFSGVPAMETPADAAIVGATEALTGHQAGAVAFGTEGPYFRELGMDTVILGPGDIEQAHQPDEFLGLDRIQPMIGLMKQLINRFCL